MKIHLAALLLLALPASALLAAEPIDHVAPIQCANLVYGTNQTSKCFSNGFLRDIGKHAHIAAQAEFSEVHLDSAELFRFPFAVMSGEGSFTFSAAQRANLRRYLLNGGFLVASAGCSSRAWALSFTREFKAVFPDHELVKLTPDHPIFHTITDVETSAYRSGAARFPDLFGLEIDGRISLIYSPDGLNDTANMKDTSCCCCGGNEIKAAGWINMNLLAFALTH